RPAEADRGSVGTSRLIGAAYSRLTILLRLRLPGRRLRSRLRRRFLQRRQTLLQRLVLLFELDDAMLQVLRVRLQMGVLCAKLPYLFLQRLSLPGLNLPGRYV